MRWFEYVAFLHLYIHKRGEELVDAGISRAGETSIVAF